jgi:NAD+ diphosphatase
MTVKSTFSGYDALAFVNSPLDRMGPLRVDSDSMKKKLRQKKARIVRICGESVLLREGKLDDHYTQSEHVFLGADKSDTLWFAAQVAEQSGLVPIRQIYTDGLLPKDEIDILAQARSLISWHERHAYCANCGSSTKIDDMGYRRHCTSCKADHFPRTDPVVIMAVERDGKFLLGRQASWPDNMYSTLAGFMEPGETIEQAAGREVKEESGIDIGQVRYVASQPWPYPSSIMIGLVAEATSSTIRIDPNELEDARWFSRNDVLSMLAREHKDGLYASRPQAIAHYILTHAAEGRV